MRVMVSYLIISTIAKFQAVNPSHICRAAMIIQVFVNGVH